MSETERIGPFEIRRGEGAVIMVCPEYLDDPRRQDDEQRLLALIDGNDVVVCDASPAAEIVSRWLKFLGRLSERAAAAGKRFVLAGAQEAVLDSADYIGIKDRFVRADSVEAARR